MLLISSKEDSYEPSCVLARVLVLVHSLSGTALLSFLAPSWPSPLQSNSEDAHHGPLSSQTFGVNYDNQPTSQPNQRRPTEPVAESD
jgi:hypothetical protein